MRLYKLELEHGLLLAPMAGYTDWPFRMACRRFGCELAYTEMISAAGLVRMPVNTLKYLERPAADAPLVAQVFGADPIETAQAARIMQDHGFAGIDINMGCPVKKVVAKGAGAALLTDLDAALRLTEAVVKAVDIPVSVKIRLGFNDTATAGILAGRLAPSGIDCLTIHPRTREDFYHGEPRWEHFSACATASDAPVIASGNLKTAQDLETVKDLGARACMIGRGAIGAPWLFATLRGAAEPAAAAKLQIILEHLDQTCRLYGERGGVRYFRKFLTHYVNNLKGAHCFRQQMNATDTLAGLQALLGQIFAHQDEPGRPDVLSGL